MEGIRLDTPIQYHHSSLRYFEEKEYHITRYSNDDVLLLVFSGVLRFTEAGHPIEVHPGEYYIQKRNLFQQGEVPSDLPRYLYVHFLADWCETEAEHVLPQCGTFDEAQLMSLLERMDRVAHSNGTYIEKTAVFYELLTRLYTRSHNPGIAGQIAAYLEEHALVGLTLSELSTQFHFSPNYIIQLFKKEYGITPFEHLNAIRLQKAKYLLEVTSYSTEKIAYECGFHHYSHFYRLFVRENGISPSDWRQRCQHGVLY